MSLLSVILATAVVFTLRATAVLVFVTGMSVLSVGLALAFIPSEFVAIGYLLSGVGLLLAILAGCSVIWFPARIAATRFTPSVVDEIQVPLGIELAMAALALLLLTQFRPVVESWQQSIDLLDSFGLWNVAGGPKDPLGFSLIPLVALLSIPIWQTLTVASFLLTSLLVLLLRAQAIARMLGACMLLQVALLVGCVFINIFLEAGVAVAQTIQGGAQSSLASTIAEWLRTRAAVAYQIAQGLVPFSLGYIGAFLWIYYRPPGSTEPSEPRVSVPSPILRRETFAPHDNLTRDYSVYPVLGALSTFTWISGGYDVFVGNSASASKHVFSFRGGRLRSHPDGNEILIMKRRQLLSPTRELREPSGRIVALLHHEEGDWFILGAGDRVLARTSRTLFQSRYCEFTASMDNVTVARYIWRQVWFKPELQIEFSDNGSARLDRRIGIALATLLERKARISTYQKFGQ